LAGTVALIVHSPLSTKVIVAGDVPEAVQTAGVVDVRVTGSPEVDDALTENGTAPYVWAGMANVIVCGVRVTAKVCPIDADEIAGAELPLVPACVAERPHVPTAIRFTV